MHTVDRIEIEGFRGRAEPFVINFADDVNFIIGRNGTGKTRLINLINAAVSADVSLLRVAPFRQITVRLKPKGSSRRPLIRFAKRPKLDGEEVLYYSVQDRTSDPVDFSPVEYDEEPWSPAYRFHLVTKTQWGQRPAFTSSSLKETISSYVKTTWLSVHRSSDNQETEHEQVFESPVDQRLHHVFRKFGTYFSTLDKASAAQTDRFQTTYFLSLISPPKLNAFSGDANQISPDAERQALREMFAEFGLARTSYSSKVETFIRRVDKAVQWQKDHKNQGVPADTFLTLTDAMRIDELVKEWADLLSERAAIYAPKSDFLGIINSLLYKKEIRINSGNQALFFNDAGDKVSPDHLSSGEKQLLIILGEALIQRGESYVFLADEPELSLHIDWQEKLVPSLRRINPSSQIIFATHSPDIVGAYGANTIDLEKVLG